MASIMTVLGLVPTSGLGMILPHEHLFTDLRGPAAPGYGQADPTDVVRRLRPYLQEIKEQRVTVLVEATPVGVGRNVRVLQALAEDADLPVVACTGAYRDAFVPAEMRCWTQGQLAEWLVGELTDGIEGTGVRAGLIKLAASDTGLTAMEERLLRAAARAARETGVAVASHTTTGATALRQAEILAEEGLDARRFIWVHAQCEPDVEIHIRLARRGTWIEYDAIGAPNTPDGTFIRLMQLMWQEHCGARILLSQDAGWYNPADPVQPIRGFGYLVRTFLPALRGAGFTEAQIDTMTVENPQYALARQAY